MNKELQKLLLAQQEEQSYHLPMEAEYSFYRRIANGDMELLEAKYECRYHGRHGKAVFIPTAEQKSTIWSF